MYGVRLDILQVGKNFNKPSKSLVMEIIEKILVLVAGIGLTALVGGAGYFFKRLMNSTDNLTESVSELKIGITGMNGIILSHEGKMDSLKGEHCKDRKVTEKRLNDHGERLDDHGERIIKLETKTA